MRLSMLIAVAAALAPAAPVQARLFRQTYGATVPTEDGCTWNLNQDYFVPRHCDSCRYDLFSSCKTSHTTSPACAHLHPVYDGYCTPYNGLHYKRRDHIYRKRCGCTPLGCTYGPWHLKKCRKHGLMLQGDCGCRAGLCGSGCLAAKAACGSCYAGEGEFAAQGMCSDCDWLPNVESMEVESLGMLAVPGTTMPVMRTQSAAQPVTPQPTSATEAAQPPLPLGILPPGGIN